MLRLIMTDASILCVSQRYEDCERFLMRASVVQRFRGFEMRKIIALCCCMQGNVYRH